MFILKKGHQPGVYVPLRALFLVFIIFVKLIYFHFWAIFYAEHHVKAIYCVC